MPSRTQLVAPRQGSKPPRIAHGEDMRWDTVLPVLWTIYGVEPPRTSPKDGVTAGLYNMLPLSQQSNPAVDSDLARTPFGRHAAVR